MVVQKMAEAVFHIKDPNKKGGGEYKDLKINRILHALLGENYTVNPKVPAFAYSAALQVGVICHMSYVTCNMYHNNRHNYTPYTD
jgi:hypothetical protein